MQQVEWAGLQATIAGGSDGSGGGRGPCVLLLHGYGAPGDDLLPLAHTLAVPAAVRFVFPAAPLTPPALMGMGRAWWPLDLERVVAGDSALLEEEPPGMAGLRAQLSAFVACMRSQLDMHDACFCLGGFSQGAMTALDLALSDGVHADRLWLWSAAPFCGPRLRAQLPRLRGVPVLQSHGESDPVLPFAAAQQLRDQLRAAGSVLQWLPFAGGHTIPPQVLAAAAAPLAVTK